MRAYSHRSSKGGRGQVLGAAVTAHQGAAHLSCTAALLAASFSIWLRLKGSSLCTAAARTTACSASHPLPLASLAAGAPPPPPSSPPEASDRAYSLGRGLCHSSAGGKPDASTPAEPPLLLSPDAAAAVAARRCTSLGAPERLLKVPAACTGCAIERPRLVKAGASQAEAGWALASWAQPQTLLPSSHLQDGAQEPAAALCAQATARQARGQPSGRTASACCL